MTEEMFDSVFREARKISVRTIMIYDECIHITVVIIIIKVC